MSSASRISYVRHLTIALVAITFIAGCAEDETVANPNIDYTDSYKVEYVPGTMEPMQGKTEFQVRVSDRSTGDATTGETVTPMPMMYMNTGMNHASPVDGNCLESSTAGTYDCTVYYLMADTMNGESVGYWELTMMIGGMNGESAMFYPSVGMAMGDTARATLKHSSDTLTASMGSEVRTHFLFKSSLTGMTDNHDFQIFTAAKESMMSFPATTSSTTLNATSADILVITSMSIEVSTTSTFDVIYTATENGNGYWTASGITGLTNDVEGTLYVRMVINGITYNNSIDGTGSIEYATFTVTPGMSM